MKSKSLAVAGLILLAGAAVHGQSSFNGLTPGRSTRADVERALGEPVREVSATLVEYAPQPLTGKIFVQYRAGTSVVERVEFLCRTEDSTCDDLIASLRLSLTDAPDGYKTEGERWKNLYGSPLYVVTSGPAVDADGSRPTPTRVALYSRELFAADMPKSRKSGETTVAAAAAESRTSTREPGAAHVGIDGVVRVKSADGSERPVAGALVEFYRTDKPGYFQTETDKYGVFAYYGLSPAATWFVVISGPGIRWAYTAGVRAPDSGLEIVALPGNGARPTREQVMAHIR